MPSTLLLLFDLSSTEDPSATALAAILAMDMLEVLVARIVSGEHCFASSAKIFCLRGNDSDTAWDV
jgi:hypothetical protein